MANVPKGDVSPCHINLTCADTWKQLAKDDFREPVDAQIQVKVFGADYIYSKAQPQPNDVGQSLPVGSFIGIGPQNVPFQGTRLPYFWFKNTVNGSNATVLFDGPCREVLD